MIHCVFLTKHTSYFLNNYTTMISLEVTYQELSLVEKWLDGDYIIAPTEREIEIDGLWFKLYFEYSLSY